MYTNGVLCICCDLFVCLCGNFQGMTPFQVTYINLESICFNQQTTINVLDIVFSFSSYMICYNECIWSNTVIVNHSNLQLLF